MDKFEEYIKARYPVDYEHLKEKYPNVPVGEFYGDEKDLWNYRQAEVDQLKEAMERQGKLAIQAMHETHKGSQLELSIAKDIQASLKPELIESERQMNTQLTDENMRLEARIDAALKHANLNFWNAVTVGLMVKALRGEHEA